MITVFTPTYNRAYILPNLYKSLCDQTCKDFEWVVVDDGSSDNTLSLLTKWKSEGLLDITIISQRNGGKHRAINRGVRIAKGDLFFIVDSDDYIITEAIERISEEYNIIRNQNSIAGIGFMRMDRNGNKIGTSFDFKKLQCNAFDLTFKYKLKGDMAEVFRTSALRKYPFPEYENEKFCPEALIWYRIAEKYDFLWINECIYVCEYRADGLSAKITKLRHQNPISATTFYAEQYSRKIKMPIRERVKAAINYWRFASSLNSDSFAKTKKIGLSSFPFILLGFLFYLKDKML